MADFNPIQYKFLEPFFSIENQLAFFDKCGYDPGPGQLEVHKALTEHRFISFSAAARFGKSLLLGSICAFGLMYPDYRIWLVGPKYDQCNREFQWVEDLLAECRLKNGKRLIDYFHVSKPRRGQRSIESKLWGSLLETKSSEGGNRNKDDLLGASLDLVGLCEGSRISLEAWTRYLYPRLGDRQGQAILPSTACEDSGLLVYFDENGRNESKVEWQRFHFTLYDTKHFTTDQIEKARRDLPEKDFREQYLSEFVSRKDKVFHVLQDHKYEEEPEGFESFPVIGGIKGNKNNPYVFFLVKFCVMSRTYYVYDEYMQKHVQSQTVVSELKKRTSGTMLRCVVGDILDPEHTQEQREAGLEREMALNYSEEGKGKKDVQLSRINTIQEVLSVERGQVRVRINTKKCPYLTEALEKCTWPTDRENDQRANMELPLDLYMPAITAFAGILTFVENTFK